MPELSDEIRRIAEIADALPERYRDRAFDALLSEVVARRRSPSGSEPTASPPAPSHAEQRRVVPAKVRAFLQRNGLTEDQLWKLVLVEDKEVHFIHEPTTTKNAVGQIQWASLLALKSALLGGDFTVDPEDVRSMCIAKGFYDRANFAATFKRSADQFQTTPESQGEPVRLSGKGESELGELIRALISS